MFMAYLTGRGVYHMQALRDSGEPLIYHREGGVGTYGPDSFTIM
jgi:hypothetical protein